MFAFAIATNPSLTNCLSITSIDKEKSQPTSPNSMDLSFSSGSNVTVGLQSDAIFVANLGDMINDGTAFVQEGEALLDTVMDEERVWNKRTFDKVDSPSNK